MPERLHQAYISNIYHVGVFLSNKNRTPFKAANTTQVVILRFPFVNLR